MTTSTVFEPRVLQRTHCANCGAARTTHDFETQACPVEYRPDTLAAAERELQRSRQAADPAREFVARGDVQRLGGDPDQ